MRFRALLSAALLASLYATGCASVQNVRTFRNHANETPRLDVALDRLDDLDAITTLLDKLLTQTPVTPGDTWIEHLALTNEEARRLETELRKKAPYLAQPEQEVPIAKRYRAHLETALAEAKSSGTYPSLLAAAGALGKESRELPAHWADSLGEKEDLAAEAKDRVSRDIASIKEGEGEAALLRSVTTGVSVAYRVQLEALSLVPIVVQQAARAGASRDKGSGDRLDFGVKLSELPSHLELLKGRFTRQTKQLDVLAHALATRSRTSLEATAGFSLQESALGQIVGVGTDSLHAHARAGGEAFFFSALRQDDQTQSEDGKQRKDLTGRLRTLRYDVKPILLASFNVDVGFDYGKITNALGLSLGYKTDRVFSSGGSIESGSFGKQLGVSGAASDALDLGLGVMGVRTNVRLARFSTGTVTYTDAAGNDLVDASGRTVSAPLTINFTQIDLGYDLSFLLGEGAKAYALEELVVGGRYFKYELPRILYELENVAPAGSDSQDLRYRNESRPQLVPSVYYMGGVLARFGNTKGSPAVPAPLFAPFFELGFYVGGGPTKYALRKNKAVECSGSTAPSASSGNECVDDLGGQNAGQTQSTAIAFDAALGLGVRVKLVQPGRRFRLSGEAVYRAELIYANASGSTSESGQARQIDFGNADLFHGPRFNLVGDF